MRLGETLRNTLRFCIIAALNISMARLAVGQPVAIDARKSVLTVHVSKSGVLSAFGHDHEISAPIVGGTVDVEKRRVELRANAVALKVQDAKVSDKDRNEIQATMLGADVLDAKTYSEISFGSTSAEASGTGAWKVTGNLTLHGQTRPVSMEVRDVAGHYSGACRFWITDFGIQPVKVAGGTIRVKDEVTVEFDIQLVR